MKKLIDSHVHIGYLEGMGGHVDMTREKILTHMEKSGTTHSIVSTGMCAEFFDPSAKYVNMEKNQLEHNQDMLKIFENDGNIKFTFWIRPHSEKFSNKVADYILANKEKIRGLKVHPFHSGIRVDDDRLRPYIDFANSEKLPVEFHTVLGEGVSTEAVGKLALECKNTNFIAVHMDMMSNHEEAIAPIAKIDNLFGDTTWVKFERFEEIYKLLPKEKILFGTDAPVSDSILDFYAPYYSNYDEYKCIFTDNIENVFGRID